MSALSTTNNSIIVFDENVALQAAQARKAIVVRLRDSNVLREGVDFGKVPGSKKDTLLKPGAERLCSAFEFSPQFETLTAVEDWDKPLFHYRILCRLIHIPTGKEVATGEGSCNSMELKYRYRWVNPTEAKAAGYNPEELAKNQWGKVRILNDDVYSLVNTIDKMACKRALVAATLIGANASEFFTQDIEDMRDFNTDVVEENFTELAVAPVTWNEADMKRFVSQYRKATISDKEALQALGVSGLRAFKGTLKEAQDRLDAFVGAQLGVTTAEAPAENDPLDWAARTTRTVEA